MDVVSPILTQTIAMKEKKFLKVVFFLMVSTKKFETICISAHKNKMRKTQCTKHKNWKNF